MKYADLGSDIRKDLISRGLPPEASEEDTQKWVWEKLPALARILGFVETVHTESDRGCVICAAALIDDALEGTIRRFLKKLSSVSNAVPDKVLNRQPQPASDALLDSLLTRRPQPPLGSFAVRTKMARALGLLDDRIVKALDGMRTMRNDAAHLALPFSFDNPKYEIVVLFEPLSRKEQIYLRALQLVKSVKPGFGPPTRRLFELAATSIYFRLSCIAEEPDQATQVLARNIGPFDAYYDDLMKDPPAEPGAAADRAGTG